MSCYKVQKASSLTKFILSRKMAPVFLSFINFHDFHFGLLVKATPIVKQERPNRGSKYRPYSHIGGGPRWGHSNTLSWPGWNLASWDHYTSSDGKQPITSRIDMLEDFTR